MNECPDWYKLADWDGREFWEFYRDECSPIVADKLNDGEKHALQSACEHLFRRGMKGEEREDLAKYRWWLRTLLNGFQADDSPENVAEYTDRIEIAIAPVLALVELRRSQKLGQWYNLWPKPEIQIELNGLDQIRTAWGPVESLDESA